MKDSQQDVAALRLFSAAMRTTGCDDRLSGPPCGGSRRTMGTIRANLFRAFGYSLVTVPLAMTGWLNPRVAAAAMSAGSLLVVTDSLRLRAWRPMSSPVVRSDRGPARPQEVPA